MDECDTQMKLDHLYDRFSIQIDDVENQIRILIGQNRDTLDLILLNNIAECFTAMEVVKRAIFEYAREVNIDQALKNIERS